MSLFTLGSAREVLVVALGYSFPDVFNVIMALISPYTNQPFIVPIRRTSIVSWDHPSQWRQGCLTSKFRFHLIAIYALGCFRNFSCTPVPKLPWGEDFKNRPIRNNWLWWPCLLMDRNKMRGPSIDASYHVSLHLAEGFQRRRWKWKVNGWQTTDAKWWQKLTLPLARIDHNVYESIIGSDDIVHLISRCFWWPMAHKVQYIPNLYPWPCNRVIKELDVDLWIFPSFNMGSLCWVVTYKTGPPWITF